MKHSSEPCLIKWKMVSTGRRRQTLQTELKRNWQKCQETIFFFCHCQLVIIKIDWWSCFIQCPEHVLKQISQIRLMYLGWPAANKYYDDLMVTKYIMVVLWAIIFSEEKQRSPKKEYMVYKVNLAWLGLVIRRI